MGVDDIMTKTDAEIQQFLRNRLYMKRAHAKQIAHRFADHGVNRSARPF
jgi:hypothetical protein